MKLRCFALFAAMAFLFPVVCSANIFDEDPKQIYWENLNNLERYRFAVLGGVHCQNRNPQEDLKYLEATVKDLQKRNRTDRELMPLLQNVKKKANAVNRLFKKKEVTVLHGPCGEKDCALHAYFSGRDSSGRPYPLDNVMEEVEPKLQRGADGYRVKDMRRYMKIRQDLLDRLREYSGNVSEFMNACDELESHLKQLMRKL